MIKFWHLRDWQGKKLKFLEVYKINWAAFEGRPYAHSLGKHNKSQKCSRAALFLIDDPYKKDQTHIYERHTQNRQAW